MSKVTVDEATVAKLAVLHDPVQICDASGRILGHFIPEADPDDLEPKIGPEEIERRKKSGSGRKLSEIIADLESRP